MVFVWDADVVVVLKGVQRVAVSTTNKQTRKTRGPEMLDAAAAAAALNSLLVSILYLVHRPQSRDASGLLQGELPGVDVTISCDDVPHAAVHLLQLRDTQGTLKETRRRASVTASERQL